MKNISTSIKAPFSKDTFIKSINLFAIFLFPIINFYLCEWFNHNPFETMKVPIQFLNIYFFELFMLLLLGIFGSARVALIIESILSCIVGLADYYIIQFRSAPIMPWDIFSVKTAASVANNFKYTLEKQTVIIILIFVLLIIIESRIKFKIVKKIWYIRLVLGLISAVLICSFTSMLHKDSTISKYRMYDKLFTPTVMLKRDGTTVAFLMELKYVFVQKPQGYTKEKAAELLSSYQDTDTTATSSEQPNIIVIMDEAFSDPAILGNFTTNEDYMPFIHDLMHNDTDSISGYANVSVLGGNTANTEFEYLTGNSMAFLPQGSIPYQQYIQGNIPSVASWLKSLGYSTVAMHPYNASGWNRDKVYPLLGFDETHFIKDFYNPKIIRKYISDQSAFDKIIELYEAKEANKPMFLFEVTMQNHSSYTDAFVNFHPEISVDNCSSDALNNYLSLVKLSDDAVKNLISYFKDQDEKTIIVFFGDHQTTNSVMEPILKLNGKSSSTATDEETALRYQVPFFIWANYDIESQKDVSISSNYLSLLTLKAANLPLSNYHQYLNELMDEYPVINTIRVVDKNGNVSLLSESQKQLNIYETLQYYQLFDNK